MSRTRTENRGELRDGWGGPVWEEPWEILTVEEARPEGWDVGRFRFALVCAAVLAGEEDFGRLVGRSVWAMPDGRIVAGDIPTEVAARRLADSGYAEDEDQGLRLTGRGIRLASELVCHGPTAARPSARDRRTRGGGAVNQHEATDGRSAEEATPEGEAARFARAPVALKSGLFWLLSVPLLIDANFFGIATGSVLLAYVVFAFLGAIVPAKLLPRRASRRLALAGWAVALATVGTSLLSAALG